MWLTLAFTCAFFTGTTDAISKRLLSFSHERFVGWAKLLFSLPWFALGLLAAGWPAVSWKFWGLLALMIPLELTAYLSYLRAIRIGPLSLTVPFLAFTPLFTVATSWLFLGEKVSLPGFLGVLGVTAGSYVLQLELTSGGLWEPLKAMWKVPGIRAMLTTALIYSVTAPLGKRAIELSSPWAFPFLYFSIDTILLTPLAWRHAAGVKGLGAALRAPGALYLLSGIVSSLAIFTHSAGILMAPVAYFIAIKRCSLLVSVLYGGLLFREPAFSQRLIGSALMLAGAFLVMVSA